VEHYNQQQRARQYEVFQAEKIKPEEWHRKAETDRKQGYIPQWKTASKEEVSKYGSEDQPQDCLKEQCLRKVSPKMLWEDEIS